MPVRESNESRLEVTRSSSLFSSGFWSILKKEADAISWNLRDVRHQCSSFSPSGKHSLDRAIASSERLLNLVEQRSQARDLFSTSKGLNRDRITPNKIDAR